MIEGAAALAEGEWITPTDLNVPTSQTLPPLEIFLERNSPMNLQEMEKSYILWVLDHVRNNRSQAAKILGIDRKTLYNKLAEYQSTRPSPYLDEDLKTALKN
jgi:DNA-binding NtrC family response regulator